MLSEESAGHLPCLAFAQPLGDFFSWFLASCLLHASFGLLRIVLSTATTTWQVWRPMKAARSRRRPSSSG
eukprot:5190668-Amphidinium_carterae.1